MKKIKIRVLTKNCTGVLIRDNRDDNYFFDNEAGMLRIFETVIAKRIDISDCCDKVAKYEKRDVADIELVY